MIGASKAAFRRGKKPKAPWIKALGFRRSISIESSTIQCVAYDQAHQVLLVMLKSQAIYAYFDVSPRRFASFLSAESAGVYYNARIKTLPRWLKVEGTYWYELVKR